VQLHPVQRRGASPSGYVAATSLDHALAVLAEHDDVRIVAGGTDLLLEVHRGARTGVGTLLDISRLAHLRSITPGDGVLHLGAGVTHHDLLADAAAVAAVLPLAQACAEIGSPALRNRATVAGNIVTASPANDTISALVALGASVRLQSLRGERVVPVEQFITGFRTVDLAADEMVVGVDVPTLGATGRGLYAKVGNRSQQAISVVHAAVVVHVAADGTTVTHARVAMGSVAATIVRLPEVEAQLLRGRLTADSIAAAAELAGRAVNPISDVRATADYRADIVPVVVQRMLTALRDGRSLPPPATAPHLRTPQRTPAAVGSGDADAVQVSVNGRHVQAPHHGLTLLDWLRDEAGATGTKEGCAEGECGACTVLMDGEAVLSCLVPAARADATDVVTVEGLATDGELSPVQQAYVECGGVQCGFCTPGFLVASTALLAECPQPTREQVVQGLSGNLCRCTGYRGIFEAVEQAAAAGGAR
jgi:xanthine dehydrogenase iron-sulfur cluster and FAD-binding subunit A